MLRSGRFWWAVVLVVQATLLASRDGRTGWTVFVGVVTASLAAAAIAVGHANERPDRVASREAKTKAKQQEQVDAILWRYERDAAARRRQADSEDGT